MPWGLVRFQQSHCLHFITFTCYRRQPLLDTPHAKSVFERSLEQTRRSYRLDVIGYVVMPEHVHLLLSEPERATLARAIQALKQSVSQKLKAPDGRFWQTRYYDFNVFTAAKRVEKLKYIHRNPVHCGLAGSIKGDVKRKQFSLRGSRGISQASSPFRDAGVVATRSSSVVFISALRHPSLAAAAQAYRWSRQTGQPWFYLRLAALVRGL